MAGDAPKGSAFVGMNGKTAVRLCASVLLRSVEYEFTDLCLAGGGLSSDGMTGGGMSGSLGGGGLSNIEASCERVIVALLPAPVGGPLTRAPEALPACHPEEPPPRDESPSMPTGDKVAEFRRP